MVVVLVTVRAGRKRRASDDPQRRRRRLLAAPWKPWQAGIAIGLAGACPPICRRLRPAGITPSASPTASSYASALVTDAPRATLVGARTEDDRPAPNRRTRLDPSPHKKVVWWLVLLVAGVMVGSNFSGRLSGASESCCPSRPNRCLWRSSAAFSSVAERRSRPAA